jgi:hypothetical protein
VHLLTNEKWKQFRKWTVPLRCEYSGMCQKYNDHHTCTIGHSLLKSNGKSNKSVSNQNISGIRIIVPTPLQSKRRIGKLIAIEISSRCVGPVKATNKNQPHFCTADTIDIRPDSTPIRKGTMRSVKLTSIAMLVGIILQLLMISTVGAAPVELSNRAVEKGVWTIVFQFCLFQFHF